MHPLVAEHYDENFADFSEWNAVMDATSNCQNNKTNEPILIILAACYC